MAEPAGHLVTARERVDMNPAYPDWALQRLTLKSGEKVFRLASHEPGQVGFFGLKDGIFFYAPISEKVMVPGKVWATAERAVKQVLKKV